MEPSCYNIFLCNLYFILKNIFIFAKNLTRGYVDVKTLVRFVKQRLPVVSTISILFCINN